MKWYIADRVLVFFIIGAILLVSTLFEPAPFAGWAFLVAVTLPISVTHFLLGWYYQVRSYRRRKVSAKYYWWMSSLLLVSLAISLLLIYWGQYVLFMMVSLVYFMIHVYLNEHTLFRRTVGKETSSWTIASLVLLVSSAMCFTVTHTSFAHDMYFSFPSQNEFLLSLTVSSYVKVTVGFWLGLACAAGAVLSQLVAFVKGKRYLIDGLVLLVVVGVAITLWEMRPLSYANLAVGLFLYHYFTWFLFFFREFYRQGQAEITKYILLHALIAAPLMFLLFQNSFGSLIHYLLFNVYIMATFSILHISTSFMNEIWFKRRVLKESV